MEMKENDLLTKLAQETISMVARLLHSVTKTIKLWSGSTHMNGSAKAIVCVGPVSPKEPVDTTKITILPELGFELWSANLIAQLDVAIDEHMKQVEAFREIEEGLAMDAEDAETLTKLAQETISMVARLLHSVTKTIKLWSGSTHMNGSAKAIVCVGPVSPKEPVDTTKITILPELGFELWSANLIAQLDVAIDEHMKQVEAFREIEEGLAMDAEDAETVQKVEETLVPMRERNEKKIHDIQQTH
ncbi:hypothetical protein ABG067_005361 [Albugo candida]